MSDAERIRFLEAQLRLAAEADDILERAMRLHAPLEATMPRLLDALVRATDSKAAVVRTRDEEGDLHNYFYPDVRAFSGEDLDFLTDQTLAADGGRFVAETTSGLIAGRRLDIADKAVGVVLVLFDAELSTEPEMVQDIIGAWSETVDNFVGTVADSHRKQRAMMQLSDALKMPILEDGIDQAIAVLRDFVSLDDLVIVFMSENYLDRRSLTYRVITNGELKYSSANQLDERIESLLRDAAMSIMHHERDDDALRELSVNAKHIEDLPIRGRTERSIIGRLIVGTNTSPLPPFARDIVDRFADYLRQRAVDFSKEWRLLSRHFPQEIVHRLLQTENYVDAFLTPRKQTVAIMYTDIAGFTFLSEQVLRKPERIGALVDRWSKHVVDIIWDTGGVFDKMIGDCIIGLWGPPFFEMTGRTACQRAAQAARRIKDYTQRLSESPEFPELHEHGMSVSTGINYCSLFVGFFGPKDDYTGFSSGMNNTARLQGLAEAHETLIMEPAVKALATPDAFGAREKAEVKNVADPLIFRRLLH